MTNLIDRENLANDFKNTFLLPDLSNEEYNNIVDMVDFIAEYPKVDTERHAHWLSNGWCNWTCSRCGCSKWFYETGIPEFCEHCGCRMDEVEE